MKKLLAAVLLAGLAFAACQKEYSLETGQSGSLTGAWEFKDSANTQYAGNPQTYKVDTISNPGSASMLYTGTTASLNAQISIEVYFPTGRAAIGSYQSANGQVNFLYAFSNGKLFKAEAFTQFSTENITVNITAITDSTVTGTFSGTALDSANRLVTIKEGKFSYRGKSTTVTPTTSVGSLGSALDTCTGAVVSGTYKKSTALTAANTVRLTVNVTTAGTYSISSDTLKGIYFGSTGSFTATGIQTITLPGVGTPTDSAAALRFRVRYGTSTCTFLVKIDTGSAVIVVPPTGDYFPTTTNSNWSYDIYDQTGTAVDSSYVSSTGNSITLAGNSYKIFLNNDGLSIDSTFFRKNAGLYYEALDLDATFGSGGIKETQFLKDNVPDGSTWTESFPVNVGGQNITLKFDYSILAKAVPATINSFSFQDVIKVKTVITTGAFGFFTPYQTVETWLARGTGNIYQKFTDNTSPTPAFTETKLRRFQVF